MWMNIKWTQIRDNTVQSVDIQDWTIRLVDLHPEVINAMWNWWTAIVIDEWIDIHFTWSKLIKQYKQYIVYWVFEVEWELQIEWTLILEK